MEFYESVFSKEITKTADDAGKVIATVTVKTVDGVVDVSRAIGEGIADVAIATADLTVDIVQALGRTTLEIARDICTGVKVAGQSTAALTEWVGKPIDKLIAFAKDSLSKYFQPCLDLWNTIKQKFFDFMLIPPIKKLLLFFVCFKTLKTVGKKLVELIDGINQSITAIGTPVGWAIVLVKLICQYVNLKSGIELLAEAFKVADLPTRYNKLGGATVSFLKAFADHP